jgi:hypothetical protein
MRKARSFTGNQPVGEKWRMGEKIADARGADWIIWYHLAALDQGYVNFKIVADGEAKRKANYWIARNKAGVSRNRDVVILKENNPYLFGEVMACLDRICQRELGSCSL